MKQERRSVKQPRTPRPKRDEVRERLVDGAMEAFSERGFMGASVGFICQKAGFTRGAFYSNFADKDELFLALYDRRIARLYQRLEAIAEQAVASGDPLETIAAGLNEPDQEELRWDILNKEFILYALRNETARDRLIRSREGSRARLARILTQVQPDLARHPGRLARLCRFIIALHEGEMTQLGLQQDLAAQPSLLAGFVPMALAAASEEASDAK